MRFRAARVSLAFALAAAMAVAGVAGSHAGARFLSRHHVIEVATSPTHLAVAALSGLHAHHAHDRATAVDLWAAPTVLLAMLLLAGVVIQRRRAPVRLVLSPAHARGPPALR